MTEITVDAGTQTVTLQSVNVIGRDFLASWASKLVGYRLWLLILVLLLLGVAQVFGIPASQGHFFPTGPITFQSIFDHPGSSGLTDIPDALIWFVAVPMFAWSYVRQFKSIEFMFTKLQRNYVTGLSLDDYNANFVTKANQRFGSLAPIVLALMLVIAWFIISMVQLRAVGSLTHMNAAQILGLLTQVLGVFVGTLYFLRYMTTFGLLVFLLDKKHVQPRLLDNHELGGFWSVVKFAEQAFVGFAAIGFIAMSQSDILVPVRHQAPSLQGDQMWNLVVALVDLAVLLILLYLPLWLIFSRLRAAKYRLLRRIGKARSGEVWKTYRSNDIGRMLPLLANMEDARQIIESLPSSLFSKHRARQESFLLVAAAIATQLGPSVLRWLIAIISSIH